jgi:hypothetical protein
VRSQPSTGQDTDHRLRRRADYLDVAIRNIRRTVASKLVLMSERQFTAAVRDAVTRHDGREADGPETAAAERPLEEDRNGQ